MSSSPAEIVSPATSRTQGSVQGDMDYLHSGQLACGEGGSVIDKIEINDNWEHDPVNPRNWSPAKKWTTTTLVS
jgi:hypothetical protein